MDSQKKKLQKYTFYVTLCPVILMGVGQCYKMKVLMYSLMIYQTYVNHGYREVVMFQALDIGGISNACTGRQQSAGKFKWRYLEE